MQIVGDQKVRIIPDLIVNGAGASGASMTDALLGIILRGQIGGNGGHGNSQTPGASKS
jgi:hypothetical protein